MGKVRCGPSDQVSFRQIGGATVWTGTEGPFTQMFL